MACGLIVQLPVTGAFGTDEDFDLRTQLERELSAALAVAQAGECGRGEIDNGRMSVCLEAVVDPLHTLHIVKDVLARLKHLHRAVVVLETRSTPIPTTSTGKFSGRPITVRLLAWPELSALTGGLARRFFVHTSVAHAAWRCDTTR